MVLSPGCGGTLVVFPVPEMCAFVLLFVVVLVVPSLCSLLVPGYGFLFFSLGACVCYGYCVCCGLYAGV